MSPPSSRPTGTLVHGTLSGYNNHHCRCEQCREAIKLYSRERRGNGSREALKGPRVGHGTTTRYQRWKCRCALCTAAVRGYAASYRERHPEKKPAPTGPRKRFVAPEGSNWKVRLYGSEENYDRWRRGEVTLDQLDEELCDEA